jgi:hypothetical protein
MGRGERLAGVVENREVRHEIVGAPESATGASNLLHADPNILACTISKPFVSGPRIR